MLNMLRATPGRATALAALGAALALPLLISTPAEAWWRGGWGWRPGVSIGIGVPLYAPPPVYYRRPPVYYAPPPPVVYAPPPRVVYAAPPRVWVPGYWSRGGWVEGHWR